MFIHPLPLLSDVLFPPKSLSPLLLLCMVREALTVSFVFLASYRFRIPQYRNTCFILNLELCSHETWCKTGKWFIIIVSKCKTIHLLLQRSRPIECHSCWEIAMANQFRCETCSKIPSGYLTSGKHTDRVKKSHYGGWMLLDRIDLPL